MPFRSREQVEMPARSCSVCALYLASWQSLELVNLSCDCGMSAWAYGHLSAEFAVAHRIFKNGRSRIGRRYAETKEWRWILGLPD